MRKVISYLILFGALMFFISNDEKTIKSFAYSPAVTKSDTNKSTANKPHSKVQTKSTVVPLEGYRWPTREVTIAITSQDPRTRQAFTDAINAWNSTKAINFQLTNDAKNANIIAHEKDLSASDQSDGIEKTEDLGITDTSYDPDTNLVSHADSSIDINKLADKSREYRMWVAEHELGHAIGLDHAQPNTDSVMVPYNPRMGITNNDIQAVNTLYSQNDKNSQ